MQNQNVTSNNRLAIIVYASLLHIPDEVEYIWKQRITLPTILYAFSKYPLFFYFSLTLIDDLFPPAASSLSLCNDLALSGAVVGTFLVIGVQGDDVGLVSLRAYSLCQGYLPMTIALSIAFLAAVVATIYGMDLFLIIVSDAFVFDVYVRTGDTTPLCGLTFPVGRTWLHRGHLSSLESMEVKAELGFTNQSRPCYVAPPPRTSPGLTPCLSRLSSLLICEFTIGLRRWNKQTSALNQSALDLPTLSFQANPVQTVRSIFGRLRESIMAEMGDRNDLIELELQVDSSISLPLDSDEIQDASNN
ncbi:hypothetical protein Clacol_008611 [Clathrus columnatus]|uniref:DUF6533 domain-containing protein n=1 Tax=Clathrus columnatus TaxID=1419009 RepID=A0AAV5AKS2_9AGAM|nr:hypothetical protein Clacol_008611 [Clathrus columnatus]